jgi:putative ABC transport system permease protein
VLGEFVLVGILAGMIAAIGAALAGIWLARGVFHIAYLPPLFTLALSVIAASILVAVAGLLGTRSIARASPLLVLRRA